MYGPDSQMLDICWTAETRFSAQNKGRILSLIFCTPLCMQQMIFSIRSLHDDLNGGSLDSLCLDNSGFVEDCIIYLKERLMNDSLLIIMIYVLIMSRTSYISIINVIIMVLSTSSYNSGKINFLKSSVNEHASMKIKYKVFRINENWPNNLLFIKSHSFRLTVTCHHMYYKSLF